MTGRRPTRSARRPATSKVATRVSAYVANTVVSTTLEKPNSSAYTEYRGAARFAPAITQNQPRKTVRRGRR
jgi:hypothetical protein